MGSGADILNPDDASVVIITAVLAKTLSYKELPMKPKVFITGMGMVGPIGLNTAATWKAAVTGTPGIDRITKFDPSGFSTQFAGEVKDFDASEYLDKKQMRRLDRFSQFAIVATGEALNHARLDPKTIDPFSVAIILGTGIGGTDSASKQHNLLASRGPLKVSPLYGLHMLPDIAPSLVSIHFGLKGPSCAVVNACSSSADALGQAFRMIRSGDSDIVVTGGTEAAICPLSVSSFGIMGALSHRNDDPKTASRPFDRLRDGFVMGEGAAILILESDRSVKARGVEPLAELAGYGATSDAYHVTAPDPNGTSASRAVELALKQANIEPEEVDYINAHGTSTPLNDKTETAVIKKVFGDHARQVAISSTKSMTGHLLGAAGAFEAALCVQAILHDMVPPTINLINPDPECDLDYTSDGAKHRPINIALSNSFGFGGHNAVLVLRSVT